MSFRGFLNKLAREVTYYRIFNKIATPLFDKFVFIMSMSDETTLEERNLINMILFHKTKLKRIQNGASADQLFSTKERRKLRRHGILTYRNMTWSISEKAGEIIEKRGVQG